MLLGKGHQITACLTRCRTLDLKNGTQISKQQCIYELWASGGNECFNSFSGKVSSGVSQPAFSTSHLPSPLRSSAPSQMLLKEHHCYLTLNQREMDRKAKPQEGAPELQSFLLHLFRQQGTYVSIVRHECLLVMRALKRVSQRRWFGVWLSLLPASFICLKKRHRTSQSQSLCPCEMGLSISMYFTGWHTIKGNDTGKVTLQAGEPHWDLWLNAYITLDHFST